MSVPPQFKIPKNIFFSIGLPGAENTFYQLPEKELIKQTDLSPKDEKEVEKNQPANFMVKDDITANAFDLSEKNQFIEEKYFDILFQKMIAHFESKPIWIRDTFLIVGENDKLKTRHISEDPKDDLFVLKAFLKPTKEELENFNPNWYFINAPHFFATPNDGIRDKNFTIVNFTKKVVLISGVNYTEKSIERILSDLNSVLSFDKK
ncbi:MAG: phosphoenolpyruvate carboxykinase (ATP) [Ginsengibacter sp.]